MVLVNEPLGYRVCLECHDVFVDGDDEAAWLAVHLGQEAGCQRQPGPARRHGPLSRWRGRRVVRAT